MLVVAPMPVYKNLKPLSAREKALPLFRPFDRLVGAAVVNRKKLFPYLMVAGVLGLLAAGVALYYPSYKVRDRAQKLARIEQGRAAIEEGNLDQAEELFLPLAGVSDDLALLRTIALHNLALIESKRKEPERALDYLTRAAQDPGNAVPELSKFLKATVLEEIGKADEAAAVYAEVKDEAKTAGLRAEAEKRWKRLTGEKSSEGSS